MKFAFFGYDFSLPVLERLILDGHDALKIFTFECDNQFAFNVRILEFAEHAQIPITMDAITPADIDALIKQGCTCFFSNGYAFKIPPVDEHKAYALNLHPTLLPHGKGRMPSPHLIIHAPEYAGLSVHKLSPEWDCGDILYQEPMKLREDEDVETLSARISMRSPDLMSMIFKDLEAYWKNAKPQDGEGSYWNMYEDDARTLDLTKPTTELDKILRAFGKYGTIIHIQGRGYGVFNARVWQEAHTHTPGTITARLSRELCLATADGYIILKDFFPLKSDPA